MINLRLFAMIPFEIINCYGNMKIKELQKTVNVAWSPAQQEQILLAAGTAAQQLDASSNAVLEIYAANLTEPGYDLVLQGSQASPYRFHKLIWTPYGFGGQFPNGCIVAGCEGGHLLVYNAGKMLTGTTDDALIVKQDKHNGPVRAIDFNPFQTNLLATGANESEILIWDLNNTTTPMNPGTKTQPNEDVQNVGWNKQVQHILASVFPTRCVIWDLRKNEPIIKLSDLQSRVRWRALQWHPDVATQLWLASEEDQAPIVQLWDLRYATAPAKSLQIHHRGVLGLSWCSKDTDLMISCGKDNKILCWNPNLEEHGDEILAEVASTPLQWYSDVQWCPRNPAIIASASLDGIVSIYSLFGGVQQQVRTTRKIADSFPGMMDDTFAEQLPTSQGHAASIVYSDLRKPPKWMRKPIGATFGFGGKLISFTNVDGKLVKMKQIITETEFVKRSNKLENVLVNGNYREYCVEKCAEVKDNQHRQFIWRLLDAYFHDNTQANMVDVLGYNVEQVQTKLLNWYYANYKEDDEVKKEHLSRGVENASLIDGGIPDENKLSCSGQMFNENSGKSEEVRYQLRTDDNDDGMICQAMLTGNIEMAVNLCMIAGRYADAIIIAMTGGSELLARTQHQYLKKRNGYLAHLISALVTKDWMGVVTQCSTDSWKHCLVAIVTHTTGADMSALCECLAERLLNEGKEQREFVENSILCYICAGNIEKVVSTWILMKNNDTDENENDNGATRDLQDVVEVAILLQKAVELQGRNIGATGKFADLLAKYASLLAAQGALNSALTYLLPSDDPEMSDLRDRLYYALGHKQAYQTRVPQAQNVYKQQQQQHQSQANRFTQQRQSLTGMPQNVQQPSYNSVYQQQGVFTTPTQPQQSQVLQPWANASQASTISSNWSSQQQIGAVQPLMPQMPNVNKTVVAPPPTGPPPPLATSTAASNNDQQSNPTRPPSVGTAQGGPARSKYVLDPSVQSGTGYGQTSNLYTPQSFNTSATTFGNQQQQQQLHPAPFIQNQFVPFAPAPVANSYITGVQPIEIAQQALPSSQSQQQLLPPPPSLSNPSSTGWNDPPPLAARPKPKTSMPSNYGQQDGNQLSNGGIYDLTAVQQQQYNPTPQLSYVPQSQQPTIYHSQQQGSGGASIDNYQQLTTLMPTQQSQATTFQTTLNHLTQSNAVVQQQSQEMDSPTPPPASTPVLQQKPPIPEEYVYMQTVFNELRVQCINAAANAQTKRKLEDVAKRLESLYDLLRDNRLTPNTLTALVQLVQYVQNGDYANGMGLHTQMVSGPDFSQIASFMPGIKVLLQTALQLQVYLR